METLWRSQDPMEYTQPGQGGPPLAFTLITIIFMLIALRKAKNIIFFEYYTLFTGDRLM